MGVCCEGQPPHIKTQSLSAYSWYDSHLFRDLPEPNLDGLSKFEQWELSFPFTRCYIDRFELAVASSSSLEPRVLRR